MIELEPDPAGQQRDAELVQAHALAGCFDDELGVQVGWEPEKELAAVVHPLTISQTVLTSLVPLPILEDMISPVAITLALAFWANTPTPDMPEGPMCPDGVHIHQRQQRAAAPMVGDGMIALAWTIPGARDCEVWASTDLEYLSVQRQCAVIAHELGHNVRNLPHTLDQGNIMFSPATPSDPDTPIPGVCFPPRKKAAHR